MSTSPKFGVFVPQGWRLDLIHIPDPVEKYETMTRVGRDAERLGFDSIWVYDHFHTVPAAELETTFEAWTITAGLARDTKTIRLGQMVTCNNYRNPALLAKIASTVDVMSHGRLDFGIGAGWYDDEYLAYGYDYPDGPTRLRMLREALEIIHAMWRDDYATFEGQFYGVRGAINEPKGVQKPHPPIWVGGGGEKVTLKLVAQYADACNVNGMDVALAAHKLEVLRGHCTTVGTDYNRLIKSAEVMAFLLEPGQEGRAEELTAPYRGGRPLAEMGSWTYGTPPWLIGTPAQLIDHLGRLVDLGIDYFIIYLPNVVDPAALELLAREVVPAFRK